MGQDEIRILIVADIRLYRDGLAEILGKQPDLKVVGTTVSGPAALALATEVSPDVILVDQAMPDSIASIRSLLALLPSTKVVALGVAENERDVIACAEAGISGYVPRDASIEDLVATLNSVDRGELLCSPGVAGTLLRRVALRAIDSPDPPLAGRLTVREAEIVGLIQQGLSNKEIANRLGIEVATAKNHVHNLLEKLGVHRRAEVAPQLRVHPLRRTSPRGLDRERT